MLHILIQWWLMHWSMYFTIWLYSMFLWIASCTWFAWYIEVIQMLINCVSCKDDSHSQNGGKNKDSSLLMTILIRTLNWGFIQYRYFRTNPDCTSMIIMLNWQMSFVPIHKACTTQNHRNKMLPSVAFISIELPASQGEGKWKSAPNLIIV